MRDGHREQDEAAGGHEQRALRLADGTVVTVSVSIGATPLRLIGFMVTSSSRLLERPLPSTLGRSQQKLVLSHCATGGSYCALVSLLSLSAGIGSSARTNKGYPFGVNGGW